MSTHNHWYLALALPVGLALTAATGCTETIDETDAPLSIDAQRRTTIEKPCEDEGAAEDCVEDLVVESADSKDEDVVDVVDFGEGFVLVEAVGSGSANVIVKGEGKRYKVRYEVSEGEGDELRVDEVEVELELVAP